MSVINRNSAAPVFDTLADAISADMNVGQLCIVKNNAATDDVAINYEIKPPGSGGIAMSNGNELSMILLNCASSISKLPIVSPGKTIDVIGYHAETTVGGGKFIGNASARHNGVTNFDPNRASEIGTAAYYVDSGIDVQCWTRIIDDDAQKVEIAGLRGDNLTVNDAAFIALCKVKGLYDFGEKDGVYLFENAYVLNSADLEFSCSRGAALKRKDGTYGVNQDGAISGMIDFINANRIKLVCLEVECNKVGAIPVPGTHLNGINFYKGSDISSYLSTFRNAEFQGLNHQNVNDVRVKSCDFSTCGWAGLGISGGYFNEYGAERAWVTNCSFSDTWAGIQSQISMRYLYIEQNTLKNSSIILAQDVVYGSISRNIIDGPAPIGALGELPQDGIVIESDSNLDICYNEINNTARAGISVVGNYIENGPREGVLICDNLKINYNGITNCVSSGITFNPGSQYTYDIITHTPTLETDQALWTRGKNCQLIGNELTANGGHGLQASIMENTTIYGNRSSLNLLSGIEIGHSKKTDVAGGSLFNNSQAAADLHDGLVVNTTAALVDFLSIHDVRIYDNQTARTQRYGINNQNAASTDFKFWNIIFERNGTDFISVVDYAPFIIQAPTLLNGATPLGGGFESPTFYRDGSGIVHFRGAANLGVASVGAVLFVLPERYRPKNSQIFMTIGNQAVARVDVQSNGDVVVQVGANGQYLSLSGINFLTGG